MNAGIDVKRTKGARLKLFRSSHLAILGQEVADGIRSATAAGIGPDGRRFPPYRDPARAGSRVDLRRSGRMLASVGIVDLDSDDVSVGPAGVPYAAEVNRRFPFIGLAPSTLERVRETMAGEFRDLIQRSDVKQRKLAKALKSDDRLDDAGAQP